MARPKVKIEGNSEVWLLREVIPYEGSIVLDIFLDPEAAKKGRPGKWRQETDPEDGSKYWTNQGSDRHANYYVITPHTVRAK